MQDCLVILRICSQSQTLMVVCPDCCWNLWCDWQLQQHKHRQMEWKSQKLGRWKQETQVALSESWPDLSWYTCSLGMPCLDQYCSHYVLLDLTLVHLLILTQQKFSGQFLSCLLPLLVWHDQNLWSDAWYRKLRMTEVMVLDYLRKIHMYILYSSDQWKHAGLAARTLWESLLQLRAQQWGWKHPDRKTLWGLCDSQVQPCPGSLAVSCQEIIKVAPRLICVIFRAFTYQVLSRMYSLKAKTYYGQTAIKSSVWPQNSW